MGASLILLSYVIAPSSLANESFTREMQLAQAQLTADQIPGSDQRSNSTQLEYGNRVSGRLGVNSVRHQGRRFAIYQFEGETDQLIRINLVGGLAGDRTPGQLRTDALLVNPVVILVDPNGEIIAQQPEQTGVANALIRMNLPLTGTYSILVTSGTAGAGGQYTLTLQQIEQES